MTPKVELAKVRDFGEIISDTFTFIRQNFKSLLKYFFIFCGFFLLATVALSTISQIHAMNAANNIDPNSFDAAENKPNLFQNSTLPFFLSLLFLLLEFIVIPVMVLSYMTLYKIKQNQVPTTDEMWGYIKFYFLKSLGGSIVIFLILIAGWVLCLIPGIYLGVILSLVLPIMIAENSTFGYAFNQSFKLIKGNWWSTFGMLIVITIIVGIAGMVFTIPAAILGAGNIFLHFAKGAQISTIATIVSTILTSFSHILYIIMYVAVGLCYFSLNESKEGTGIMERINQFGTNTFDEDITPEEY